MPPSSDIAPGREGATRLSPVVQRWFKVVAIALGLFIGAGIGEISLRLLRPEGLASSDRERELFCRFDPLLGWSPLPNVTGFHAEHGRYSKIHQNQFGMRAPDDMQLVSNEGKRRVLVFGDSYTWGFGVSQNELFSAPEVHGTGQELLNFGVSGYGTDQEYLLYLTRGTQFHADEVVVAFTPYNDVDNNLGSKQYGYLKPYFTLEGEGLLLHTNHIHENPLRNLGGALSRYSRFYSFLGEAQRAIRYRLEARKNASGTATARTVKLSAADVSERDRKGVDLTVAILKRFHDAAQIDGAKFTVIFIPYKPHIDSRLKVNHPLVPLIAAGLNRMGIDYLEPYDEFLAADSAGEKMFHEPDNHFGPAGHALFAKLLTKTNRTDSGLNYYARHPASPGESKVVGQ